MWQRRSREVKMWWWCALRPSTNQVLHGREYRFIGSLFRNRVKFQEYLNRRLAFNPRRAFKHYRAPSRVFWKTVRGMLNYKSKRGWASLGTYPIVYRHRASQGIRRCPPSFRHSQEKCRAWCSQDRQTQEPSSVLLTWRPLRISWLEATRSRQQARG